MFNRMLRVIARIPRGQVATYGDIAYAAGYPGASRQVAWALHSSRGLPWQRVLGAGGRILLTGQHGFEQRLRLEQEGVKFLGPRADLKHHQCPYAVLAGRKPRKVPRAGTSKTKKK